MLGNSKDPGILRNFERILEENSFLSVTNKFLPDDVEAGAGDGGVEGLDVDGGRHHAALHAEDAEDRLHRPGGAQEVAEGSLVAGDETRSSRHHLTDGGGLGPVPQRGGGGVSVHGPDLHSTLQYNHYITIIVQYKYSTIISDLVTSQSSLSERLRHGGHSPGAVLSV